MPYAILVIRRFSLLSLPCFRRISMKKIAWLLVAVMLLTCLISCNNQARSEVEKAFTTVSVSGGVKIVHYTGNYSTLEIPSTIGGKTVVEIGDDVFAKSYLLTEVVIPDTVKVIGARAFQGCLALERIVIPDSVIEIGEYAFFGCWAAKTLEIGAKLNKMGDQAIQYCKSLEKIIVSEENDTYKASDDGVLFTADYKTLLCYPASAPTTSYTIPNNCVSIADYAFRNNNKLEKLTVGAHVTEIGDGAFYACEKLKEVSLAASVEYLGYTTFADCAALEEIVIPEGIKTIGYLIEQGECGSTFDGCVSLRRVVLPTSLTNVYASSFLECAALAEVDYCGGQSEWKNVIIGQGNDALTSATIRYDYTAE